MKTHCKRGHAMVGANVYLRKNQNPACHQCKNDRETQRRTENRRWFLAFKKTLKCSRYPEDHPACLEFHHLDPGMKEFKISGKVSQGMDPARIRREMQKCLVLCANCHAKEHWTSYGIED